MIKKVAQSYQELHDFVKNILFNPNLNIRPALSERTRAAKDGISEARKLLEEGKNPFTNIYLRIKILGDIDEESFDKSSVEKIQFKKLFDNLSLAGTLDAEYVYHSCQYIISQLESLYEKYEGDVPPQSGAVSFSEEEDAEQEGEASFNEEDLSSGPWYVTSGNSFSLQNKFFGPFEKQMGAILFSILVHPDGTLSEKTVLSAHQALMVLKSLDQKISDLSAAYSIKGETPVNANIVGMVELAAKELDPNSPIQLSTSGEVFEALVEYLEKNIALSDSGKNIEEVKKEINFSFIKKFVKSFFEIKAFISKTVSPSDSERVENLGNISAPPEFNKADVIITPVETGAPKKIKIKEERKEDTSVKLVDPKKIKLDIPEGGSPAPKEAVEAFSNLNISSISIINPDNPELLSDQLISNFLLEMRQRSSGLANLRKDFIENSLSSSFELLKNFFKDCLDKDKEIKKEILSFREKNQFVISQAWTPSRSAEWEFQNKFSITKRIIQDPAVSSNIKEFFLNIVEAWFFSGEQKALKKIKQKVRSINDRYQLKLDSDALDDADYKVLGELIKEIRQISKVLLEEKINDIISSSNLDIYDTSLLIDDIILNDIKISSYIHNRVHKTLQPEENIIEQQSFYTINCGVCGQTTQVPSQYKDDLISFSNSESQYSFFREDGSFISDAEIESKTYNITDDSKEIIKSIITKGTKNLFSNKTLDEEIKFIINKNYSWEDINSGIYNPRDYSIFSESVSLSSEIQILTNTIFQIIRNDVLKQLGATPAGSKGIFGNKTLCAASLIKMTESFRQDKRILENLKKKMDYSCLAKINASYNPEKSLPVYYSGSYTSFSGPKALAKEINSGFGVGYRFSRNLANCPCHIGSDSAITEYIKKNKRAEDYVGLIAIPNIPENIADSLSKNEKFGASKQDIYYPPTSPDGLLASRYEDGTQNLSSLGYLVCGKSVSISMFDKDPSSQNYIRKVLETILLESGLDSFTSAIKILIDYGIEINDIKPYVESILESQGKNKTASLNKKFSSSSFRRKFLSNLFENTKISFGQDLSTGLNLIKKLGLVCESGHKFTLEQSWNFAKTHSAVFTSESRFKKVKNAMLLSLLDGNLDSTFKIMASTSPDSGIGLLRVNFSEDQLRSSGFITPTEVQSFSELKNFIETKKLYFKSDDGSVYIFDKPSLGAFKDSPWDYEKLSFNSRTDLKINRYSSGRESTTVQDEGGGSVVKDIADTSSPSSFDSRVSSSYGQSSQTSNLDERLKIINVIYPNILENELRSLVQTPTQSSRDRMGYFNEQSGIFIDKFIKMLKMSRVWGKMSADSQIDFLAQFNRTPEIKPTLTSDIENTLRGMVADLNIDKSKLSEVYLRFFKAYDFNGLVERNISYNQFLSLAGIAQYYRGFETPFIANLTEKAAKGLIVDAIYSALKNNIGYIFDIDNLTLDSSGILNSEDFQNKIKSLSNHLFSPYSSYPIEFIKENAIINYTGRAIIFSYAIDIVNSIRSFFNKHFLNKASSLYIGPTSSTDDGVLSLIEELLQSLDSGGGIQTPNILIMEEGEFEAKVSNLRDGLMKIYQPESAFTNYLKMMSISYDRDDSNTANIYRGVVFSRFGKCLQMASSSLDYLISDLIAKPLGTKDTRLAAESLDSSIEFLVKQRDPDNYDKNKKVLAQTRVLFGEPSDVFQKNAIQYGRLSLDSSSISLEDKGDEYPAPMMYRTNLSCFTIPPERLLNGLDYTYKFGNINTPYLIMLSRVYLSDKNKSYGTSNLVYICLVPKDIQIIKKSDTKKPSDITFENIDLMNLIPPEFIKLNNTQGMEFASRYIGNLSEIDTSRLILVSSDIRFDKTFTVSTVDSAIKKNTFIENVFEIRVQKIDESTALWPPPNNLFINNIDIARGPEDNPDNIMLYLRQGFSGDRTEYIEKYYQSLFGGSEREFLDNLEKFNTSYSQKSIAPLFSHGIVLPIGGDSRDISMATNITVREDSNEEKVGMTISESKIYIPRGEKDSLNISWMFATNDPQFKNESGQLRIKLIQSGVVQKLAYIGSKIMELYSWFSSQEIRQVIESIDEESGGFGVSFDSQELFIDTILSEDSVFVQREINPSYGFVSVRPYSNSIINSYPDSNISSSEFLSKFGLLCDFFNAAQRLNRVYDQQKPILSSVPAVNLAKKQATLKKKDAKQSAFCIKMLDPYTLWMMVNNPVMHSNFGGPINPEDIDDYKNFIISTFGLERLKDQVLKVTGFDDSEFKVEDLFDLINFYNKNLSISKNQEKLLKFSNLFKLNINESGGVDSYRFGIPVSKESSSALLKIMNSLEFSEYAVDSNSYLEYPVMLRSSLDDIGESELKKIIANVEKKVQGMIPEIRKEVQAKVEGMSKEEIEEEIRKEILRVKTELIISHPDILESRKKLAALSTGEKVLSIQDIISFATKKVSIERPRLLVQEGLRIVKDLWGSPTRKISKNISWRKIAQSTTDDDGTIIRSLYHRWWAAYLDILAKTQN